MDKSALFEYLSKQEHATLLDLLSQAYDQMEHDQRRWVFGKRNCWRPSYNAKKFGRVENDDGF